MAVFDSGFDFEFIFLFIAFLKIIN